MLVLGLDDDFLITCITAACDVFRKFVKSPFPPGTSRIALCDPEPRITPGV
jgi:hypothetical protein